MIQTLLIIIGLIVSAIGLPLYYVHTEDNPITYSYDLDGDGVNDAHYTSYPNDFPATISFDDVVIRNENGFVTIEAKDSKQKFSFNEIKQYSGSDRIDVVVSNDTVRVIHSTTNKTLILINTTSNESYVLDAKTNEYLKIYNASYSSVVYKFDDNSTRAYMLGGSVYLELDNNMVCVDLNHNNECEVSLVYDSSFNVLFKNISKYEIGKVLITHLNLIKKRDVILNAIDTQDYDSLITLLKNDFPEIYVFYTNLNKSGMGFRDVIEDVVSHASYFNFTQDSLNYSDLNESVVMPSNISVIDLSPEDVVKLYYALLMNKTNPYMLFDDSIVNVEDVKLLHDGLLEALSTLQYNISDVVCDTLTSQGIIMCLYDLNYFLRDVNGKEVKGEGEYITILALDTHKIITVGKS